MNFEEPLKSFGLSENEVKVYLATLSLGTETADNISKKSRLLRTTTYEILKSLANKGLCSHVIKDKKRYFEVADPETLIRILEEKKSKLNEILPELIKLKETTVEKPIVEVYEGKEGLRTILDNLIRIENTEYKVIGNNGKFRDLLQNYYVESFINKRLKKNIFCKFIAEPGKETNALKKTDKQSIRTTKEIKELTNANAEIFLYADKIAIFTLIKDQPIGITIQEKNINLLLNEMFNQLFKKIAK